MKKIQMPYLCVGETAQRHPKDLLKSAKKHSKWGFCIFNKSTRTTKHNSPVFFLFFLHHEAQRKEREKENSEGQGRERVEVGGGLEMNGSGGFIGCCQGG